ncbi:hypothetical protein Lal_00037976 [Lupinus albus]|uniref:Uncharacterized protein n=1 Tax=Lupinus albus TaxID=3870 RepID=A0A6A4QWC7_LUPAL|nr:hypothetical protein Lalb_Chr03g0040851 [Lupinus albus]KAF1895859.1 hypothetical protein Lal_00037976 [Lupinus albus]
METCVGSLPLLLPDGAKSLSLLGTNQTRPIVVGMQPLPYNIRKVELRVDTPRPPRCIRCAAALNAKGSAGQTQTLSKKSSTAIVTPDKVKSPKLDDNGPGFPPRDDDGNGGNGGGGGGNWSGGLALLGILGGLDILKDIEIEWLKKGKKRDPFVNAN